MMYKGCLFLWPESLQQSRYVSCVNKIRTVSSLLCYLALLWDYVVYVWKILLWPVMSVRYNSISKGHYFLLCRLLKFLHRVFAPLYDPTHFNSFSICKSLAYIGHLGEHVMLRVTVSYVLTLRMLRSCFRQFLFCTLGMGIFSVFNSWVLSLLNEGVIDYLQIIIIIFTVNKVNRRSASDWKNKQDQCVAN